MEKRILVTGQANRGDSLENATFKITDIKLYIPVVTLSAENDYKLLEQPKTGFKRTVKWNKYRSEMSNHTKNNNLNYLIDPTFTNVIDYLFYHLKMNIEMMMKMKVLELLSRKIMYQKLK